MADYLFYGIDETGRTDFSEVLPDQGRPALEALARDRLRRWHAVEIWQGPMCVVRLRRAVSPATGDGEDRSPG